MPKGHKTFRLRGGADADDFPAADISLKDIRAVGRIAWEKWGHMVADKPIRDLIALAYAEGLYHGAQIALRNAGLRSTIGTTPDLDSSAAAYASPSATNETKTLSVRDLLESL
jgi:hypothetical protein